MQSSGNYQFYGTEAYASEVERFVRHIISSNRSAEALGKKKTPVCIWGFHGIGKTEMVERFAKEEGFAFSYVAPAQFEEMGDLLGMPAVKGDTTVFIPPDWVPREDGPGILLLDDVNRADDRILRGIMQLLQNYELSSWSLPKDWHIILTANPDGGDYSVTPMDDAMLTRMLHITMRFDVKEWARWAEGADVDPRGINFVLTYPEILGAGTRTTPRSLVQFFQAIAGIEDLEKEQGLIRLLADASLDKETATAFIAFVRDKLGELPSPESILSARDYEKEIREPLWGMVNGTTLRIDLLSTLCTRLINYMLVRDLKPDEHQKLNVKSFMLMDFLPNDLRLGMARDLMRGNAELKSIMTDPELSLLLLENM